LRQSNGEPVLIDFGAVKETMSTVVNSKGKPTYSIVLGTPGFMPPEQASGRPIYASDLYSLGMTAIYLLTGKLPQELDTDLQTEDLLWQQHALNVSPSLAAVINKAIQYHPRDRYTTAMKMLDALQSVASMPPRQSSTHATLVVTPGNGKQSSQLLQ
jgi:serine/threonine-protein kinase